MPEKKTLERARRARRQGKAPTTQAGAFVHEEIEHVRKGKHGARNTKQAIAIGLSKARRAGVKVPAKKGASASTRRKAEHEEARGQGKAPARRATGRRKAASRSALKREGHGAASHEALSKQARTSRPSTRRKRASTSTATSARRTPRAAARKGSTTTRKTSRGSKKRPGGSSARKR